MHQHGFIREVRLRRDTIDDFEKYPFNIPAVEQLDRLEFDPRVTFLIGENGSGKSTLIEAVAILLGLNPEGGTQNFSFINLIPDYYLEYAICSEDPYNTHRCLICC